MDAFSLDGKTVLVTGASSGIGRGIAIECSKRGAVLYLNGRNSSALEDTKQSCDNSDSHFICVGDISEESQIDDIISRMPVLDGCVFAAGIPQVSLIKRFNKKDLQQIFAVNTLAPMLMVSKLLKNKKLRRGSSIVFIESITGIFIGSAADVAYNASKGGLNGFMKGASVELASQGIRVNAINPGLVPTPILQVSDSLFGESHHIDKMKEEYPLKRLGKPEDIAYGAIYFLSSASSWVTGTNLVIDGGYTAK